MPEATPTISVNLKYLKRKGLYVFCKGGHYWGLTPAQVQEMHNLTGELLAKASGPQQED